MATVHQIRELVAQTTTGPTQPRVPRKVPDELCPSTYLQPAAKRP